MQDEGIDRWRAGEVPELWPWPQNLPDAVNHADFPSPWLQPGQPYVNRIRYEFGVASA